MTNVVQELVAKSYAKHSTIVIWRPSSAVVRLDDRVHSQNIYKGTQVDDAERDRVIAMSADSLNVAL